MDKNQWAYRDGVGALHLCDDPNDCTETVSWSEALERQQKGLAPSPGFRCPGGKLYITEERKELLDYSAELLSALSNHMIRDNTSCRLILGSRGIGKSCVLKHLVLAASAAYHNTMSVYVDLKQHPDRDINSLLSQEIKARAMIPRDDGEGWQAYFSRTNAHLFLVVDEAQKLWAAAHDDVDTSLASIRLLYAFSTSSSGTALVYLAGCTAWLHELAFANTVAEEPLPMAYHAVVQAGPTSLNPTRMRVLQMHRPRTHESFVHTLNLWWHDQAPTRRQQLSKFLGALEEDGGFDESKEAVPESDTKEELPPAYTLPDDVGAWPEPDVSLLACVATSYRKWDELSMPSRDTAAWDWTTQKALDELRPQLGILMACIESTHGASHSPWDMLRCVPKKQFDDALLHANRAVKAGTFHHWADHRYLYFDLLTLQVGFMSPMTYILLTKGLDGFTLYDQTIMQHPFSKLGVDAEWWVAKGLATTASKRVRDLLGDVKFDTTGTSKKYNLPLLQLPSAQAIGAAGSPQKARGLCVSKGGTQRDAPWTTSRMILRETPDVWGGDLVVVAVHREGDTITSVVIHRVQVKLGRSTLAKAESDQICEKLARGDAIVRNVVAVALKSKVGIVTIKHVLCTTRPLGQNVEPTWSVEGKTLLGRDALREVWPDAVSQWASDVHNDVYMRADDLAAFVDAMALLDDD